MLSESKETRHKVRKGQNRARPLRVRSTPTTRFSFGKSAMLFEHIRSISQDCPHTPDQIANSCTTLYAYCSLFDTGGAGNQQEGVKKSCSPYYNASTYYPRQSLEDTNVPPMICRQRLMMCLPPGYSNRDSSSPVWPLPPLDSSI